MTTGTTGDWGNIVWKAFKLTFGSVWGWLGIIVGAVSLINLGVTYFSFGIGPILTGIVDTYEKIFHAAFDVIFSWISWTVSPWVKDVFALWTVFGAATVRGRIVGAKVQGMAVDPSYDVSITRKISEMITVFPAWPIFAVISFRLLSLSWGQMRVRGKQFAEFISARTVALNFAAVPAVVFTFIVVESGMPW